MPSQVFIVSSIPEAREVAASGGVYLVVDAGILQQIEAAEAQGGYEGGMTGNADGAPYTAEGHIGEPRCADTDPPALDISDLEGVMVISLEGVAERVLDLKDVLEALAGKMVGPMIIIPTEELQRWLGGAPGRDGA